MSHDERLDSLGNAVEVSHNEFKSSVHSVVSIKVGLVASRQLECLLIYVGVVGDSVRAIVCLTKGLNLVDDKPFTAIVILNSGIDGVSLECFKLCEISGIVNFSESSDSRLLSLVNSGYIIHEFVLLCIASLCEVIAKHGIEIVVESLHPFVNIHSIELVVNSTVGIDSTGSPCLCNNVLDILKGICLARVCE